MVDMPRSPVSTPDMYRRYCWYRGLFSPSFSSMAATCSSLASSGSIMRAGLPLAMRMSRKAKMETKNKTISVCRTRLPM